MGYTKLFNKILASSIWNEDDKTRLVWITLLAMRNERNVVQGSIGGVAHQARVSLEDCKRAIDKLCGPDPDDSSGVAEGRRLEPLTGGWLIINGEAYCKAQTEDERKAYHAAYMRVWRRKKSCVNVDVNESDKSDHMCIDVTDVRQLDKNRVEENRSDQIRSDQKPFIPSPPKSPEPEPEWKDFVAYALSKDCTQEEAKYFYTTWRAQGWTTNNQPIYDWKAKIVSWHTMKYYQKGKNGSLHNR